MGVVTFGIGSLISYILELHDASVLKEYEKYGSLPIWANVTGILFLTLQAFFIFSFPRVNLRMHPFFDR